MEARNNYICSNTYNVELESNVCIIFAYLFHEGNAFHPTLERRWEYY
jgi:hypothetical protein